jgi:hypothetical protein
MSDEGYVAEHLYEKVEDLHQFLGKGLCRDFAEYTNICGQIRGVRYSLQTIEEYKEKLEKEENE